MRIIREEVSTGVFSAKLRWLAILTGCFAAIFGVQAFGSPFLIFGAVVQPRALTLGRWLSWIGALLLSVIAVPLGIGLVFEQRKLLASGDPMLSLFAVSVALVCSSDVVLIVEGLRSRRNKWVRGSLDWVVWIAATILSGWQVWSNRFVGRAFQHVHDRPDLVLTALGFAVLVLLFDVALIIHATKTHGPSGSPSTESRIPA